MISRGQLNIAGWILIVLAPLTILADWTFVTPIPCLDCFGPVYPPEYAQLEVLGVIMAVVGIALVLSAYMFARAEDAATVREIQGRAKGV